MLLCFAVDLTGEVNEMLLFHGTSTTPPAVIYDSDVGFDHRLASRSGFYGSGIYFACNAEYSHKNYAHMFTGSVGNLAPARGKQLRQLLLAKVSDVLLAEN